MVQKCCNCFGARNVVSTDFLCVHSERAEALTYEQFFQCKQLCPEKISEKLVFDVISKVFKNFAVKCGTFQNTIYNRIIKTKRCSGTLNQILDLTLFFLTKLFKDFISFKIFELVSYVIHLFLIRSFAIMFDERINLIKQ